jgi:hypothetical protein
VNLFRNDDFFYNFRSGSIKIIFMKQIIFTFLILLGYFSTLLAQKDSAVVAFFPAVDSNFYIQIDGQAYENQRVLKLEKKTYDISVWSPGYVLKDTFIDLSGVNRLRFVTTLTPREDYVTYLADLRNHQKEFYWRYVVPVGATVAAGTFTYISKRKADASHAEALLILEDFLKAPNKKQGKYVFNIQYAAPLKTEFIEKRDLFQRQKSIYYTGLAITGVTALTSTYLLIKFKSYKAAKPTYQTEPNPFELNGFGLNYIDNAPVIYFSFKF